jgi:hypothetical protein
LRRIALERLDLGLQPVDPLLLLRRDGRLGLERCEVGGRAEIFDGRVKRRAAWEVLRVRSLSSRVR